MSTDTERNVGAEGPRRMKRPQCYFLRKKKRKKIFFAFLFVCMFVLFCCGDNNARLNCTFSLFLQCIPSIVFVVMVDKLCFSLVMTFCSMTLSKWVRL